jgi:thermostable 8-oxoguanine DNA glycosylase
LKRKRIEDLLDAVDPGETDKYSEYFRDISPKTHDEFFRRFLFAISSVNTPWERNVRMYQLLAPLDWLGDRDEVERRIRESRAGMHTQRSASITQLGDDFFANPEKYYKQEETWEEYRQRLVDLIPGLGYTKVSFTIEMCWAGTSQVVCLDRHFLKMYKAARHKTGFTITPNQYRGYEKHWVKNCCKRNLPPAATRLLLWDNLQGEKDSRYWSYVLEESA